MDRLDALVEALSQAKVSDDAYNQYAHGDANNDARRHNLRLYLQQMAERNPTFLLVGEAPGYRGSRLTGAPFVSRIILARGIPELGLFGTARGYRMTYDVGFEKVQGEQSGTIVWSTLAQYSDIPLIWGSFPFHPHQPGNPLSNRPPRRSEIEMGKIYLREVIEIFAFQHIVAVGNVAHATLHSMGIEAVKIRHPAQGGKNDFVQGIKSLYESKK
jgi:uracil-DNA glycosylase